MHRISAQDSFSARWALASVALSMLLSSLGTSIANVGLPTLALALQVSFQEIQWVVLIYLLAVTTSIVSVGHLGDLIGRRRLLLWGILLFTLASVLCGMALGLWWLVVARALQGIGAAIMMAMSMSFVIDVAPDKTGSAMGLLATMSAIGTALGPSVGGVLIAGFGWRAIFWLLVPLGLIVLALAYRTLPTTAVNTQATPARFDKTGASLLIVTLAAYALSMTWGRGHYGVHNVALLLVAIVGACCFVWVQARVPSPLIRLSMLRDVVLTGSLMMTMLVSTVMMATLVVGPFYLARVLALGDMQVGAVLAVGPIVAACTGIPAGRLTDRYVPRYIVVAGLIGITVGAAVLSIMSQTLTVAGYILAMVIVTAGYALFQTANNTMVMSGVGKQLRGVVSGMLNLARNLGLITGASVMGAIFAFGSTTVDTGTAMPNTTATGMGVTFASAVLLMIIALMIAIGLCRHLHTPSDGV